MSAPIQPPPLLRKPRRWPLVIIPICLLAPLVILSGVFVGYRVSNAIAVSRLEAKIKQKGEPLTLTDLAATYPPIPDEENGAILLLELWQQEDPEFWLAYLEGKRPLPERRTPHWDDALPLLGNKAKRISRTTELTPENLAAATTFATEQAEHLEKLRLALRKPRFRFPLTLTEGFSMLLPHLPQLKREAQSFNILALLAIQNHEPDVALAAIEDMARTGQTLSTEPTLISQLVRIVCYDLTINAAERLLSRHALSPPQLERLGRVADQIAMPGALRLSFLAERTVFLNVFNLSPMEFAKITDSSNEAEETDNYAGFQAGMRLLGFIGLKDADRRLILETMEQAIALAERSDARALQECEALFTEVATRARRMPPKIFSAMLLPAEEKAAAKFVRLEGHRRTMLVALAVERYRWRHNGQLPDRLEQLVPDLLPTLPPDPFDDNPLRYKRLPAGFMVYSIGPDRTDDGGLEPRPGTRQTNFDVTFTIER